MNADSEDNVMALGEEKTDLFRDSMQITVMGLPKDDISITYNKERQTWTKTLNAAIIECYFLSRPVDVEGKPITGYWTKIHNIWKERYGAEITE